MKKFMVLPVLGLLVLIPGDADGFGRGGGGGGRIGGGGGGAVSRPAVNHTPSFGGGGGGINRPNPGGGGGGINRPNTGGGNNINRPNVGGGGNNNINRPSIGGGGNNNINRPNIGGGGNNTINRPNIGGGGNNTINRPNIGGGGNNTINRPNIGIGNRPNINSGNVINGGNRTNISGNNVNLNRSNTINNQRLVSNNVNVNRGGNFYRPGYSYYHGWYGGWHHGYWNNWNYRPWVWGGAGLATGLVLGATTPTVVYANPYYDAAPADVTQVFDYSQPIPVPEPVQIQDDDTPPYAADDANVPAPIAQPPEAPADASQEPEAAKLLDAARASFMKGDYNAAQQQIDKAVSLLPGDATLHEFRALVLFARKDFREAAAVIHAVLAVGPGWDWDTMKTLYPDVKTYTAQLRALEEYCRANPMAASARFLLAYHYLVLDSRDAAINALQQAVKLLPSDELAVYLLKSLTQKEDADRPTPAG